MNGAGLTPDHALLVLMRAANLPYITISKAISQSPHWCQLVAGKHKSLIKSLAASDPTATDLYLKIAVALGARKGFEAVNTMTVASLAESPQNLGHFARALKTLSDTATTGGLRVRSTTQPDKPATGQLDASTAQSALAGIDAD